MQQIIKKDVPLWDKNWFRTGGNAQFYAEPKNTKELHNALEFAHQQQLPLFVLGQGANILISDAGFDGLVIRPQLNTIEHLQGENNYAFVIAEAGVLLDDLITYCLQNNFLGLEEFSGIPGTVGGAAYINLHYFNHMIADFLVGAAVINKQTGRVINVDTNWFDFGYNQSRLHAEDYYLASATFKLKKASDYEVSFAKGRRTEIIRHRTARYPTSHTCGSFFRNFHDNEVELVINGKKMIYIAYYLDKIGIKGTLRVGDAVVSYQHANMLVNCGNATTADITGLAHTIQKLVKEQFGIIPQPECRLIGFTKYPLLKK